jgi:hypothetical protein
MSVRSLSRTLAGTVAAGVLTLAMAGAALAVPARPDIGMPGVTMGGSGNITSGTDVAAPDQQNTIPAPVKPKIASPPTWPLHPQTLTPPRASSPSADTGFQWDDAGIGAGGALLVVLVGLGGVMAFRRRTVAEPPLAA